MTEYEEYAKMWEAFAKALNFQYALMRKMIMGSSDYDIHEYLQNVAGVPYSIAHQMEVPGVAESSNNIGAVTGIYFEQNVASVVIPYIQKRLPDTKVSLNKSMDHKALGLPRDPDMIVSRGDRQVVIEIKTAPKKRDVEWAQHLKDKYETHGIGYYLIANYVSLRKEEILRLSSEGWFAMLSVHKSHGNPVLTRVDELLDRVITRL